MNFTTIKNKIFIFVFLGILVFPWVGGGLLRLFAPSVFEKLSIVETEKRQLQQVNVEELMDTGESLSGYIDDRIPFRYSMISWYKQINDAADEKYQIAASKIGQAIYKPAEEPAPVVAEVPEEAPIEDSAPVTEFIPEVEEPVQEDPNFYPLAVYQDVIIGREGWLFLYGENEIECYQGSNILSDEAMVSYANKLNELQNICNAKGKQLYIFIAPNKSQVFSKYMPTVEIVNTYKREQRLHAYLSENCSTPFIYPLTECLGAASAYQTYYKYDSHWNHFGALYGTNALYAAMGVEQTDPTQWIAGTVDAEKYELYTYMGMTDDSITHDDTEYIMDYRPEITVNGLDPNAMVCRTTSDGANQRKLCLIGDSFRVNMMPYIAKDFTNCTFAHRDYMTSVKADIKAADIIVIEAVERYDYEAFATVQRTINILSK